MIAESASENSEKDDIDDGIIPRLQLMLPKSIVRSVNFYISNLIFTFALPELQPPRIA